MIHAGITGGHLGIRRTSAGVALRAYWPDFEPTGHDGYLT